MVAEETKVLIALWSEEAVQHDITNTGNGEPGTGVWELMYSGNPLENSKWRSKQKKGSKRNNLGKAEFPPTVPPDGQYVLVRAESDQQWDKQSM